MLKIRHSVQSVQSLDIWLPYHLAIRMKGSILLHRRTREKTKEEHLMSKKWIKLGIGLGILTLGAVYLGKKTGLLEDDLHLYYEFESI